MKKLLISLLTASVLLGSSVAAFADTTSTTTSGSITTTQASDASTGLTDPSSDTTSAAVTTTTPDPTEGNALTIEQQRALFYAQVYMPDMTSIVNLRVQTANAIAANNSISTKIQTTLKLLNTNNTAKIKTAQQTVSNDETQLKSLTQQANSLKSQFSSSIKSQNTSSMSTIQQQYQTLLTQINTLTQKIATDRATVNSLEAQLLNNKAQQVQPLIQQAKSLAAKIKQEEIAKNQLWTSYNAQMKANDFTSAGKTLQSIITAKTQILQDINSRGTVLNQLLTAANTLSNQ
jgi:flagellar biosynthesis chaperone FliJ